MVVGTKKKIPKQSGAQKEVTARLLFMGAKGSGKSASIVRYTTGRYIQEYGRSTGDWLCRRQLPHNNNIIINCKEKQTRQNCVELLEQKDIDICNTSNLFQSSSSLEMSRNSVTSIGSTGSRSELASRVAYDQQTDLEMAEKQKLLDKLQWANAYVIVYAINDVGTFNKAIKYLNLIANLINCPTKPTTLSAQTSAITSSQMNQQQGPASNHRNSSGSISSISSVSSSSGSSQAQQQQQPDRMSNLFALNKFGVSSSNSGGSGGSSLQSGRGSSMRRPSSKEVPVGSQTNLHNNNQNNQQQQSATVRPRRPILLLANKRDLEKAGRQVSTRDGRLLAIRHQSAFAEISIAESSISLEEALSNLLEQVDPTTLHISMQPISVEQQLPSRQPKHIDQHMLQHNYSNNILLGYNTNRNNNCQPPSKPLNITSYAKSRQASLNRWSASTDTTISHTNSVSATLPALVKSTKAKTATPMTIKGISSRASICVGPQQGHNKSSSCSGSPWSHSTSTSPNSETSPMSASRSSSSSEASAKAEKLSVMKMAVAKVETVERCSSQLATTANVIELIKKFVASH